MQTRIIIHRAYGKDGHTNSAVEVAGRLLPFRDKFARSDALWFTKSAHNWIACKFGTVENLRRWKQFSRQHYRAHRFERVTMLGDTHDLPF